MLRTRTLRGRDRRSPRRGRLVRRRAHPRPARRRPAEGPRLRRRGQRHQAHDPRRLRLDHPRRGRGAAQGRRAAHQPLAPARRRVRARGGSPDPAAGPTEGLPSHRGHCLLAGARSSRSRDITLVADSARRVPVWVARRVPWPRLCDGFATALRGHGKCRGSFFGGGESRLAGFFRIRRRTPVEQPKGQVMTAADLRGIILSADFKLGLEEVSSYLASIMQEAPIVHLLAKYLWKQKHLYALERNKRHDLTVWTPGLSTGEKQTTIEFKFNYETCAVKLGKELRKFANELGGNPPAIDWTSSKLGSSGPRVSDVAARLAEGLLTKTTTSSFRSLLPPFESTSGQRPKQLRNRKPPRKSGAHHLSHGSQFLAKPSTDPWNCFRSSGLSVSTVRRNDPHFPRLSNSESDAKRGPRGDPIIDSSIISAGGTRPGYSLGVWQHQPHIRPKVSRHLQRLLIFHQGPGETWRSIKHRLGHIAFCFHCKF